MEALDEDRRRGGGNQPMSTDHTHTPELRHRLDYNPAAILANAWVCAECEAFLGWAAGSPQ